MEAIELVQQAIVKATDRKMIIGKLPLNLLLQSRLTAQADSEVARDVLGRVLQSVGGSLSWQVLCDGGEASTCSINIHMVSHARHE